MFIIEWAGLKSRAVYGISAALLRNKLRSDIGGQMTLDHVGPWRMGIGWR